MRQQRKSAFQSLVSIGWYWVEIIRIIITRFIKEGFTYRVSALTYATLLAIVPVFGVLFSVLSVFQVFHNLGGRIQAYIFENFIPATGHALEGYFSNFIGQATKLPPVGIMILIIVSIMLMLTIERTFNDIWTVTVRRRGLIASLFYWAIITMGPICLGVSFALSSYLFSSSLLAGNLTLLGLHKFLLHSAPFLLTAVALTLLNLIVPNCQVKFRFALLGGLFSAVLIELAKQVFAHYAYQITTYTLIYGAIAVIPLFLVWIYTAWFIVLIGVMLAHTVATRAVSR
jgi:membrane protein